MADYTKNSPGAPVGAYALGDTVTDSEGTVWECVTPGPDSKFDRQGGGGSTAADVSVDPEGLSNIAGDDVQEALGELDAAIDEAFNLIPDPAMVYITESGDVSAANSGRLHLISCQGATPLAVNLPDCAINLHFRFRIQASSGVLSFTTNDSATFTGWYLQMGTTGVQALAAAASFQVGEGDANSGDWFDIEANEAGNGWIVSGATRALAS